VLWSALGWVVLLLSTALVAGCGSSSSDSGAAASDSSLKPPTTPTAADCQAQALATSAKPETLVPAPGTYTYAVKGTRREQSSSGVPTKLAPTAETITTPSIKAGNLRCWRAQRRYTPKIADTYTFVVRGGDVYIAGIDFYTAGRAFHVVPKPPIKGVDASNLNWQGSFSGPTNGQYAGSAIGRKTVDAVGGRQRALGVELRLSFGGQVQGTTRQDNFVSLDKGLLLSEDVTQDRTIGGQPVRLAYKSRLKSAP
jgi:hypothetical protein